MNAWTRSECLRSATLTPASRAWLRTPRPRLATDRTRRSRYRRGRRQPSQRPGWASTVDRRRAVGAQVVRVVPVELGLGVVEAFAEQAVGLALSRQVEPRIEEKLERRTLIAPHRLCDSGREVAASAVAANPNAAVVGTEIPGVLPGPSECHQGVIGGCRKLVLDTPAEPAGYTPGDNAWPWRHSELESASKQHPSLRLCHLNPIVVLQ